ncbi:EAL domain-containing protein [Halomonas sp. CH40]
MSLNSDTRSDWPSTGPKKNETGKHSGRVLLAVAAPGNRLRLMEILESHFTVQAVTDGSREMLEFDLAVVDIEGLQKWRAALVAAKRRGEPIFLPVMLVLGKDKLHHRIQQDSEVVDAFVITPTNTVELVERACILLRARRMALEQSDRLAYIINHDAVTGLANRPLFEDRLQIALAALSREDKKVFLAVIHVPMDMVMGSLGTLGLDAAARAFSSWLRSWLGDDIEPARLTTNDWGIIFRTGTSVESMMTQARKIHGLRDRTLHVGQEEIRLPPRVGIAIWPDDSEDVPGLIGAAMAAAGQANGTDGEPAFYSPSAQEKALWHIRTENELSKAVDDGELELWFQPKIRLADRVVIGAEALVRWRRPSGELVSPGEFIPVAEKSDLILKISRWVLDQAFRVLSNWRDWKPDFVMAINITPADVGMPDFIDRVDDLRIRYGVLPENLEFELTETMLCEVAKVVLERLRELRAKGGRIAVDDFGTGYSSLSYLQELPVDVLKIDKSFIDRIPDEHDGVGIVEAIISLAHHFHLGLVAEGVEYESQADFLQSRGVDNVQGYYFARPMPAAEFVRWMKW